jgi:GNAT superfamily N-acetyltransferase
MNDRNFEIHALTREELDVAVQWAADEGWNPGLHDADAYYACDPNGFFMAFEEGQRTGFVSVVKYTPHFSFMGFFIVRPDLRGGWIGPTLAEYARQYNGRAVAGLDSVLDEAGHYSSIFGFEPAYHNMRYKGTFGGSSVPPDSRIRSYAASDLEAIERYDRDCFPAPRHAFLERWFMQPEAHALVDYDGATLTGYGMVRPAHDGWRIGPLFADNPERAGALFDALVSRVPAGSTVYIDIPLPNQGAVDIVSSHHMTPMFETVRMYIGPAPQIALDKVFGVTTLELG